MEEDSLGTVRHMRLVVVLCNRWTNISDVCLIVGGAVFGLAPVGLAADWRKAPWMLARRWAGSLGRQRAPIDASGIAGSVCSSVVSLSPKAPHRSIIREGRGSPPSAVADSAQIQG